MKNLKENKILIPLIILLVTSVNSIYVVATTDIVFGNKQYLGFITLAITSALVFLNQKVAVYITGILLLAGTFNLVAFTPAISTYSIGFSLNDISAGIKIQPFSFVVLILYSTINYQLLLSLATPKR
jgi:hypothetical protein